jgi:uncharacterized protein
MHLSHYLKVWEYPEKPGHLLLYSTRKASLCLLPADILARLEQGEPAGELEAPLVKLGVLVPDREKEPAEILGFLEGLNRRSPGMSVAVILGLDCNFACTYCYEGSLKGKYAMGPETAERLVKFIRERLEPGKNRLTVDFYGGEPLLYTDRLSHISGALKNLIEEQGGEYRGSVVTNGSLLTRRRAEELARCGVRAAKITLDGPAESHNRFRPFKSGKGSFDCILANVRECCDILRIGIGGNFTRESYRSFPALLDRLGEAGLGPERLAEVRFDAVVETGDEFSNPESRCGCLSSGEPWLAEAAPSLREEILKRGYKTPKIAPSSCMVDMDDAFTVHYDGTIYKCPGLIGHKGFEAGTIDNGIGDYRAAYHVDHWRREEACRDCVYLPLCFGGCRFMQYQRDGLLAGVDCQRPYLDAVLETLIRQDAAYRATGRCKN